VNIWGVNLVLVARRADRLEALRGRLLERHPALRVDVVQSDLAAMGATAGLAARLHAAGQHIDVLVNSAGMGSTAPSPTNPRMRSRLIAAVRQISGT
jgi:short-subunit dehydrogenase